MHRRYLHLATLLAYLSSIGSTHSADLLLVNGDFESWSGGYQSAPSELGNSGTGGYTALTGWDVGPGSSGMYGFLMAPGEADNTGSHSPRYNNFFKLWGPGTGVNNGLPSASPLGGNFLALDGAESFRGNGISQSVGNLTIGAQYNVGFWWAAAQQSGYDGATTEQVAVSFGTDTQSTSVFNLPNHGFSGWMYENFVFTPTSTAQTLKFLAIGTPNGLPPTILLDGLSVTAVPEPSTIVTCSLGMLFLGIAGYRRRKTGAVQARV